MTDLKGKKPDLVVLQDCKSLQSTAVVIAAEMVSAGFKITFGVPKDLGLQIAAGLMTGKVTKVAVMYVVDREEFDRHKDGDLTGIQEIMQERSEHFEKHRWNADRDKAYINGELLDAAVQYIGGDMVSCWPDTWDKSWYKPGDRIVELRRAGALIAAEIDRLKLQYKEQSNK